MVTSSIAAPSRYSSGNLAYTLPGGQEIRFWDDARVYLGNQVHKKGSDRCYGLTADPKTRCPTLP